jgi:hypothetical protein
VGLFSRKRDTSPQVGLLLAMDDAAINKLLREHRGTPFRNAKALRKASADGRRPIEGERGMGAIFAALEGGGTGNKNWKNLPVDARVHPSVHRETLAREARKARRKGDRVREAALRREAILHGYIKP